MSQDNKSQSKRTKSSKRISIFRLLIVIFLMVSFIIGGAVGGLVLATIKNAPEIDSTKINALLTENSVIVDKNGNLIEKIQTDEYRTIVDLDKIPKHLINAFIAIEDERFETHIGIDFKRIVGALIADIKAGAPVQGASTITQQLVRNLYLSYEKKITRKIIEAYLAIQLERQLSKEQILEAYLNTIPLGQSAFGVQEAAYTYFSKDVSELTLAESAIIAGIPKGTSLYAPFYKEKSPKEEDKENIVGYVDVNGERYACVFNERALERQKLILGRMKELGYITENEYNEAISQDIKKSIKPGQKKISGISSYFADYIKEKVLEALVNEAGYTREDAERQLYTGGLKIYSTMDVSLQHKVENIYDNFGEVLFGDLSKVKNPVLEEWKRYTGNSGNLDKYNNLVDDYGNIIYYKKDNLIDSNNNLIIENGTYTINENGDLVIKSKKINIYPKTLDIVDCYTVDAKKNLVTHTIGSLDINTNYSTNNVKSAKGEIIIPSTFLKSNRDFYTIDSNNNLLINSKYFYFDSEGIVQPQSAVVIIDYRTGEIKALVGGRNIEGNKVLNRATHSHRQPGSAIKPIAVYLPALDNGFTASYIIDDVPHYDSKGNRWPKNWYDHRAVKYWGLTTLRESVESSINVSAVKMLEKIGIGTSIEYLTRFRIINEENPKDDSFISRSENPRVNDETLASLALGGMTKGLTPLELTAAYGTIANNGIYVEPICFTKVVDRDGKVILEKKPFKNSVVTPQVAYIMSDILKSTVTSGLGGSAKIYPGNAKIPVAGKTGTTQSKGDIWFVGYTPYYAAGVWIGNDNPQIKLSEGSSYAAKLWSNIMKEVHNGLPPKDYEVPDGLVTRKICTESGKLATELCERDPRGSTIRTEIFVKGTEPIDYCDTHVEADIDTSTGKLATEFCPPELVEKRVFIKRNPPYNPEEHNGLVPADYQYTLPTEQCDVHTKPEENIIDEWIDWFLNDDRNNDSNDNSNNDSDDDLNHDSNDNQDENFNDSDIQED